MEILNEKDVGQKINKKQSLLKVHENENKSQKLKFRVEIMTDFGRVLKLTVLHDFLLLNELKLFQF